MPFGHMRTIVHQGDENAFESCVSKIHFRGQNLTTQSQMSSAKYFLAYYTSFNQWNHSYDLWLVEKNVEGLSTKPLKTKAFKRL